MDSDLIVPDRVFDLRAYLEAPPTDVAAEPPAAYEDQVIDLFYGEASRQGALLPWKKTHDVIRFRAKEVTCWAGYNGSGKSQLTTQVALEFAYNGEVIVIGSFEMAPERTLYRMIRQAARTATPSIAYIRAFLAWAKGRIWLLNKRGTVSPDYVLAAVRYCQDKLGATHFIVDNLAKCVRGEDDFNGQKDFVDSLCSTALDTGIHIHLIHHLKKGTSELEMPDKMAIKGSGAIIDQVDNAVIVWRNKKKEQAREQRLPDPKLLAAPDVVANIVKQRNGTGIERAVGLWYAQESMSYAEDAVSAPRFYDISPDLVPA